MSFHFLAHYHSKELTGGKKQKQKILLTILILDVLHMVNMRLLRLYRVVQPLVSYHSSHTLALSYPIVPTNATKWQTGTKALA